MPTGDIARAFLVSRQTELERGGQLAGYQYLPAIKADLLRRLGRTDEASAAYRQALELTGNDAEREFPERLADLRRP